MLLYDIFVKHKIDFILMEVVAKHYIATVPITSPMGCSSQMFFCYFIAVPIGKTCSYCFISLLTLSMLSQYFTIETVF